MFRFALISGAIAAPVVEVSLASSANQYPQVQAAISAAEASRRSAEAGFSSKLQQEYDSILAQASGQLTSVLQHRSFLSGSNGIHITLLPGHVDQAAGASAISSLASKQAAAESALVASAATELAEFAKTIVAAYANHAGRKSSFLGTNVKVVSDPSYATIGSLGADMANRANVGADLMRAKVLDLHLRMAKSLNAVARSVIRH